MKKIHISPEANTLMLLVKAALTDGNITINTPIDNEKFLHLIHQHRVRPLVLDGMTRTNTLPLLHDSLSAEVAAQDASFIYYQTTVETLCGLFRSQGLTPIILKGIGLAMNYPNPKHRGAGDIDIFLLDRDGRCGAQQACDFLRNTLNLDVTVCGDLDHHASTDFRGVHVEIHYFLTDCLSDDKKEYLLLNQLNRLLPMNTSPRSTYLIPSATFNALYLLRHFYIHCYSNTITYRQLVDLAQLIRTQGNSVNWPLVTRIWQKSTLRRIYPPVLTILEDYLGVPHDSLPPYRRDPDNALRILGICFNTSHRTEATTLFSKFMAYYHGRWRTRFFTGHSWLYAVAYSAYIHVRYHKDLSRAFYHKQPPLA